MDARMQARRVLELDLHQALQGEQFEVFYQPLIDVRTREVTGFEALLRWRHPVRGLVSPDQFIPLAEETGMIVPIGEWVLRQACAAAANWPRGLKVAVNLSAAQFKSQGLVAATVAALRESDLPADRLELEITETVMLHDTEAILATLHQFRELGIQIAMDDFGTGYSSLSYLRRFPFDRIKIDQSFVRDLGKQPDCMAIVRAVAALGGDLGMAITAEGVETRQQLDTLERAGCTEIQGYLFSRPVPGSQVMDLLRTMSNTEDVVPLFRRTCRAAQADRDRGRSTGPLRGAQLPRQRVSRATDGPLVGSNRRRAPEFRLHQALEHDSARRGNPIAADRRARILGIAPQLVFVGVGQRHRVGQ
jgi:EAL domain-containing protein (putative c-di-GMP-specific phosphodiesterase class I)